MEDIDLNLDDFIAKVNSDLVGKLVNIPSRTSGFISKFFNNMIMSSDSFQTSEAKNLHSGILKIKDEVMKLFDQRQFSKASRLLISHIESVNEYVNSKEPWVLAKNESNHNEKSTLHEICSASLMSFRLLSIYLSPVMPNLTGKVAEFFNEEEFLSLDRLINEPLSINKYEHLLKRIEQNDIDLMVKKNTQI